MNFRHMVMLIIVCILGGASQPVLAGPSQNECAIWLCMPAGFPGSDCKSPHKAMIKRIKKGKSPLPSLSSCMVDGSASVPGLPNSGSQNIKTNEGRAAYYYNRYQCNRENHDGRCIGYKKLPNKIVMDNWCKKEPQKDAYKSDCKTIRYMEAVIDGKSYGTPLFYDDNGNTYELN
ncbi:hypothetical protein POY29_25120 [Klebsiella pneumoniae]